MKLDFLAFLVATGAVVLAEMGDKTQLLAMAFATRYKASKVLLGVLVATVFNHALAVALGSLVARLEPLQMWIQIAASLSFLLFGLWTIRGDRLEGEENRRSRFGPVLTVTIAFFIAELGDKTQLTTIALSAKYPECPLMILAGTTTGMLIADAIGIVVGVVMCRSIPERKIKLVSAGAFILFGLIGSFQSLTGELGVGAAPSAAIVALLAVLTGIAAYYLAKRSGGGAVNPQVAEYCKAKRENGGVVKQPE